MSRHRVALMQPYFLPYIGYWQLMAAVDEFVVYDTVQYSSGSWVNRNRIRLGDELRWITVPLEQAPHSAHIQDRRITLDDRWRARMLAQVGAVYRTAPLRSQGIELLEQVLASTDRDLTGLLMRSITLVAQRLGITTRIRRALELPAPFASPSALSPEERVIAICQLVGATDYFNLSGGQALYHADRFAAAGMSLHVRVPPTPSVDGTAERDDQALSILDLLMRREAEEVALLVRQSQWTPSEALTTASS